MSVLKWGLLLLGVGLLVVVAVFYLALHDRTADVSAYPLVRPLLGRPLPTVRAATLFRVTSGLSTTRPVVLVEQATWAGEKLADVPVGTPLTFTRFLRHTNAVSGFTYLVGLGQAELPTGRMEFEYVWGSVDAATFTATQATLPPAAPVWQPAP